MPSTTSGQRQADTVRRFWYFDLPGYEPPDIENPEQEYYWDDAIASYWDGTLAEYWDTSP